MDRPADRLRALLDTARRADRKVVVVGIGNELLGDDAVGDRVARELAPFNGPRFEAIAAGIAPENAAPLVSRAAPDILFIIDAAAPGGGAGEGTGTAAPWDFYPVDSLDTYCHSTHSVPLSLIVGVWRQERPILDVHFIGLAVCDTTFMAPLSPPVDAARAEIVGEFREMVNGEQ